MMLRKIFPVLLLLSINGCTRDSKNDSEPAAIQISAADVAAVRYEYGDLASTPSSYVLDISNGQLDASWNRREIVDGASQEVNRRGNTTLEATDLATAVAIVDQFNDVMVSVDRQQCGTAVDSFGPSIELSMKSGGSSLVVAEEQALTALCADAYVKEGTLKPLIELLKTSLPEPAMAAHSSFSSSGSSGMASSR